MILVCPKRIFADKGLQVLLAVRESNAVRIFEMFQAKEV